MQVASAATSDPIFAAIVAHKCELDQRNQTIEVICAAEDRHKAEERETWHRYEEASILLTTKADNHVGRHSAAEL
jgi:ribosomal protein L36